MLESFNLVSKRQMVRYEMDWTKHFILTNDRMQEYVCLNIEKLRELSEEGRIKLLSEMLNYLYGQDDTAKDTE